MQIDMHLFGVYALARAAGIKDRPAWDIAYSSQFVDDSIEDDEIVVGDDYALLPTMSSHKPLDYKNAERGDQWKVWLPFHFLPGNEPKNGTLLQRLVCRKNSKVAQQLLDDTLDEKNRHLWPHLIGVVAHVFADTFAHYGFIGISTSANKARNDSIKTHNVKTGTVTEYLAAKLEKFAGIFAALIPVGHGTVATYPDIPFLSWEYRYESDLISKQVIPRENEKDFLDGARELHRFFGRYAEKSPDAADPASKRKWEDIEAPVKEIIQFEHQSKEDRIEKWRTAIRGGVLFPPTKVDKNVQYNEYMYTLERLKEIKASREVARDSDACKFHRAVRHHRWHVIHELLPAFDIVVG